MKVAELKSVCQKLMSTGLSDRGFYLWLSDYDRLARELAPLPLQRVDIDELAIGLDATIRSDNDCRRVLEEKLTAVLRPLHTSRQRTILAITNPVLLARYSVSLAPITNVLSESLMAVISITKPALTQLHLPEYVRFEPDAAIKFFMAAVEDINVVRHE